MTGIARIPQREKALMAYQEKPSIVHERCGVTFHLPMTEALLLSDVIAEQRNLCDDTLSDDRKPVSTQFPELAYLQTKVIPQIKVARDCLRDVSSELAMQIAACNRSVVTLEPTRLQVTFLLQAVEWMDILGEEQDVVDLARFRLSRMFEVITERVNFEFDFWLATIYIDKQFGLSDPPVSM